MATKRWWIVALVTILALVVLGVGGYGIYRIGYSHGNRVTVVERELPQRFLDKLDELDREGKPLMIVPRLKMREFGHGFMFPRRDLRHPFILPWQGFILPAAILSILVVLIVLLIVLLTMRKSRQETLPPAPLQPPASIQDTERQE